jgi:hypothetical protein
MDTKETEGMREGIKVFCCYAHEDRELLIELRKHLRPLERQGLVTVWHDGDIGAGANWEEELKKHLEEAQIILLLISKDFIDSDYCYGVEMQYALKKHKEGKATVIPVILRDCLWHGMLFGMLQALPPGGRPVTGWDNKDTAFLTTVLGIGSVVEAHRAREEQLRKAEEKRHQKAEQLGRDRRVREEQRRIAEEARLAHLAKEIEPIRSDEQAPVHLASESAANSAPIPISPRLSPLRRKRVLLSLAAVLLIIAGGILFYAGNSSQATTNHGRTTPTADVQATAEKQTAETIVAQFTATAVAATVVAQQIGDPYGGTLIIADPMRVPGSDFGWDTGNSDGDRCNFENDGYHAFGACYAKGEAIPAKFALQLDLTTSQSCAGIDLNFGNNDYFIIGVCQDGNYILYGNSDYPEGSASSMHTARGQSNLISIVADGTNLTLYLNHTRVASVSDHAASTGSLLLEGLDSDAALLNNSAAIGNRGDYREVIYSNAFLWSL